MELLLVLLAVSGMATAISPGGFYCENCTYSIWGLGYMPTDNCHEFVQCQLLPGGGVQEITLCCGDRTVWSQEVLNCVWGMCSDSEDNCPDITTPDEFPCPLMPDSHNPKKYVDILTGTSMTCPIGTQYDALECTCNHFGDDQCEDDPLMYFPFTNHTNDIQCHQVIGIAYGDAELVNGSLCFDGDGDYLVFGFLNNYFAGNQPPSFTVSLWFFQLEVGYLNFLEGLFGNGDCQQDPSIWIAFGSGVVQGEVSTTGVSATFTDSDFDYSNRSYPFETWCQFSVRWTPDQVCYFINGIQVGYCRDVSGDLVNTQSGSSFGMMYLGCEAYFFTGCLDDLIIFDRYVDTLEMAWLFGRYREADPPRPTRPYSYVAPSE